jgi:predicted amidohydrolase YtcJ
MLNSAAIDVVGAGLTAAERTTGHLWRADSRLRGLLAAAGDAGVPDVASVGAELAGHGITHVTDATADLDEAAIELLNSLVPQHLFTLAETGSGPRKIVLADHELISLSTLTAQIRKIHGGGRPVAIHSVTAATLAIAIAALNQSGSIIGDRIEHAAICDDMAAEQLAQLNVTVITQPSIIARNGRRFREEAPASEHGLLWRYGGLMRAGVTVSASSDAPYGDADPWRTIGSATRRGRESVSPQSVLQSMLSHPQSPGGPARRLGIGSPADLCVLQQPLDVALDGMQEYDHVGVAATFISGELVHANAGILTRQDVN